MIAPYVLAALEAPLAARPNAAEAEVRAIAERDRKSPFAAALQQWARDRAPEPELPLIVRRR